MNKGFLAALAAAALLTFAPSAPAQGNSNASGLTVPISGSVTAVTGTNSIPGITTGTPLSGTFKIQKFAVVNNQVQALGTVTLTYADRVLMAPASVLVNIPSAPFASTAAPTAQAAATCQILNLTLGPLDLNLLGLTVHLNQVVLNIGAEPGAGNLLGNLLCAVANLLNGANLSNLLQQLVNALNGILAAL